MIKKKLHCWNLAGTNFQLGRMLDGRKVSKCLFLLTVSRKDTTHRKKVLRRGRKLFAVEF